MVLAQHFGINNVPQELIDTIPPLKQGQEVVFRSLIVKNHFDAETGSMEEIHPSLVLIYRDEIRFKNNTYPIGIVDKVENGQIYNYKKDMFGVGTKFSGRFSFFGGRIEDEAKYIFCMLSNLRKGNPNRDLSYPPLFELVDTAIESKDNRKKRNLLNDALTIATGMNLKDVREFVAALNEDETQDEDIIREIVEEYAEENPAQFLEGFKNPVFKVQAEVRRALDSGFIVWDASTNKVRRTDARNTTITTLEGNVGDNWVELFAEFLVTSTAGKTVLPELRKKVKAATLNANSDSNEDEE